MNQDRLFLDDASASLSRELTRKLVDDPSAKIDEQDIQDFEVGYSISSEGSLLRLQISYPFLADVLKHGSQNLLEKVWEGLPIQLGVDNNVLSLAISADDLGDAANRQHCVQRLVRSRTWLLIGPLVERLTWLRDVGSQKTPPFLTILLREQETCWIVVKPDRVTVIFSVHLQDEADVALGRIFCREFAEEANRKPREFAPPCSFNGPDDIPSDVRSASNVAPNVGFLSLTVTDQVVKGASDERLWSIAEPVMTLRNFFHFHLKNAKSYLHSGLRKRLDGWEDELKRARRASRKTQDKRRLPSGKEFKGN